MFVLSQTDVQTASNSYEPTMLERRWAQRCLTKLFFFFTGQEEVRRNLKMSGEGQASRKLFMTRGTFCPANLRFFAGHFRLSSDIFKLRMTGKHRFIFSSLDILSGDLGALRRTFSKFAGHVRRVRRISGSLEGPMVPRAKCLAEGFCWFQLNVHHRTLFMTDRAQKFFAITEIHLNLWHSPLDHQLGIHFLHCVVAGLLLVV